VLPAIEGHQGPVHGFLQGVQGEQALRRADREIVPPRGLVEPQQAAEQRDRQLAEPLALGDEPLLEGGFLDAQPGEEVAVVEGGSPLEVRDGLSRSEALEQERVDLDEARRQRYGLAVDLQGGRGRQRLAHLDERLTQAVPSALVAGLGPQQRRQLVPGHGAAAREREVRDERLGLAGGERQQRAVPPASLEAAQQRQGDRGHVEGIPGTSRA